MIQLRRLYANNFKQLQEIELIFPASARVLVQGKNEAGKSTLFEAVFFGLFGAALVSEGGARNLDALIAYEKEKARVELEIASGNHEFKIVRTIVRGKPNVWELDVLRPSAGSGQASAVAEEIRGNNAVNKRLVDELGFDGEALLNTCFVEQKKLEKLEGMTKAKREESLAKLLNLDALLEVEGELKIRSEDQRDLERLRQRAELAEIQSQLPAQQKELDAVEQKLALMDLRGAVAGAVSELQTVAQLDAQMRALASARDAAAQKIERMNALREAMGNVKDALDTFERAEENTRETARMQTEYADAARAANDAPNLQSRANGLRRLLGFVQRLAQIRVAGERSAQRAEMLADSAARVSDLHASVTRDEAALAQLETRLREYEIGVALGNWIAATRAASPELDASLALKEKQAARDKASRRLRVEVYALAALLFVFVAATFFLPFFAFFALMILALLAWRASSLWRELARASEELGRAEGAAGAQRADGDAQIEKLKEAHARLAQLQVEIPATIDLAQSRRVMIARAMNNKDGNELHAENDALGKRLSEARAVMGELTRQNQIADAGKVAEEARESTRKAQKSKEVLERWKPRLEKMAVALGVDADAEKVQRAVFQLDAQSDEIKRRAREASRLKEELARRAEQSQALWTRVSEAYTNARTAKADAPAWNPSLAAADYTAFGKDLRAEYDALGGEAAMKAAREIEGELGRVQGEHATRARNAATLTRQIEELLETSGQAREKEIELTELKELEKRLAKMDLGDENTLRVQHREFVGRVRSLEDQHAQLERALGLQGEALERDACRAAYEKAMRHTRVRERGAEIAQIARRRMMQKVLPATMDYMRRILPSLTRDRYHDAQLDEESFKIQVWDERAGPSTSAQGGGAWKEKNIFSGGTRDQFSLALRLAFALATLPQERGAAPSFIFLDEPLGSFDDERAEALIYLLTEGEIARAFDQIFLISHVHVDGRLFTHRVVLENGRVAFSDLPQKN